MVHFSEAVDGVTASDFTLLAPGTVSGSVQSVTGSGADYVVTVSGLDGQGTVGLSLVAGAITDLAGNAVVKLSDTHAVSGTTQPTTIDVSDTPSGLLRSGTDPSPSASGRLVAFTTLDADRLTRGPANSGVANVVVRDTLLGITTLVSVDLDGKEADGSSGGASVSADGTEIAFASDATNLLDGGTTPGETNIYLARLTEGADGPVLTRIELVSEGNGQQGEGVNLDGSEVFNAPILSADGSTIAFDSTEPLVKGAESGVENVYAENVATGAITLVSSDGRLIASESTATDLGGAAVEPTQEILVPSRGYVFNSATGVTTSFDGTDTVDPSAAADTAAYNVYKPVLSGGGSKLFYEVHEVLGGAQVEGLYQ